MKSIKYVLLLLISFIQLTVFAQENAVGDAEFFIRSGDFERAIEDLNSYIELNPSDARAYINRAIAHGNLGETKEKERDLLYAKHLNPFAHLYISNSARSMHYAKKTYEYNVTNLTKEFSASPVKSKYYKIYLKEIIDQHSQDSLLAAAIYHLSINDVESTEVTLNQIQPSKNIVGIIYDIKGLISLRKNDLPEAIKYFTLCIEEMPDFPLAYHNRAVAYKLSENYEAAKNDLYMALSLNEDISVIYFSLAKLSEIVNENEEATEYYQKALDKDPEYIEARTNYSLLQKTLGNYNESMLDLQNILDATRKDAKANYLRGGILLTYGEYEKATDEFDRYLKMNEEDPDALFNRGLAKLLQGNKSEGCEDIFESINTKANVDRSEIFKAFCPTF